MKITTQTLMKRLFKASNLDTFLHDNDPHMAHEDFTGMLDQLCLEKHMTAAQVIERADIERTYGYQLFNGTRKPSRDKILQLAVGLGLNVPETQTLLRSAGRSLLYPRIRRDAIVLYGLNHALTVFEIQNLLNQYDLTLLGGQGNDSK